MGFEKDKNLPGKYKTSSAGGFCLLETCLPDRQGYYFTETDYSPRPKAMNRLEQLLNFLKEDPNDAFTLYAIATEYQKTDTAQALAYYQKLLIQHPGYVPTYYHAAKLHAELGNHAEAERTFKKGLEVSLAANNRHAHRELQAAHQQFLDELEE